MLRESLLLIDCYFPRPLSTCDTGTLTLQNLSMPLTSESRMDYLLAWKSNDTVETASMLGLPGCRVIVVKFDGSSETLSLKFVWCLCWSRIWRSCETSSFEFVNCFSKWSMYFFWCTSWNYKKLDWLNSKDKDFWLWEKWDTYLDKTLAIFNELLWIDQVALHHF